jgi:hypothetical protein
MSGNFSWIDHRGLEIAIIYNAYIADRFLHNIALEAFMLLEWPLFETTKINIHPSIITT